MRRRILKLLVGFCLLMILVSGLVADEVMKQAPHAGFGQSEAAWRFTCRDFPRFWQSVESSAPFQAFTREWPSPFRELEVAVRRATGVRPTYARWRLWMGHELTVTGDNHHAPVFCVRPGLLLRVVHAIRPVFHIRRDGDLYRLHTVWYAWKEGYLFFSTDRNGVAALVAAPMSYPSDAMRKDEARLDWLEEPRTSATLRADDAWRVTGTVDAPLTRHEQGMNVHEVWNGLPMLVISAHDMPQALALIAPWRPAMEAWPSWTGAEQLLSRIQAAMGPAFGAPGPCSIAVIDIERAAPSPTLQWAALSAHPEVSSTSSREPPLTEPLPVTVPVLDGTLNLTVDPPAMLDHVASAIHAGGRADADLLVSLEWSKLAADIEEALTVEKESGTFDFTRNEALERYWIPMVRGLGALGRLHLEARGNGKKASFEGYLAQTP